MSPGPTSVRAAGTALPIVAIVGRPNVGKSTLFNRYAGSRRALVEDTPGVTRDRIVETVEAAGRSILLVDTAGLDPDPDGGLEQAVQAQAEAAVEEADAILFVVDGKGGLLPEDEEIARTLRKSPRPLLLLVNKIDAPSHQVNAAEFHRLGLPMRTASAEHGSGAWDALEALVEELPEGEALPEAAGEGGPVRIALVGRPNVGKSSWVNRLLGSERVVVSDVPGTTRDSVDSLLETERGNFILVDTAGLRRPGRRDAVAERASAYMTMRALERADVAMVVIDASEGFTDQDARVCGLARERGRPAAVLANKWDLLDRDDPRESKRVRDEIDRRLRFMADTPVLQVSAKSGARGKRILPLAQELAKAGRTKIATPVLNEWLKDATARHEPAMAQRGLRRKPVKFLYATQVAVLPPTIVLFCTAPDTIQKSYVRFLENRLRERFGLEGSPVRLLLRHRRKD
ncbi:MAG: ribosome biogenesis GTPase Der [Deltaproteobacteria bacterium]|nr:ribosome biogenesis GTPase Der [Deltaproteobacteria bacterium]MBW2447145.1 ribosome biogenesis GTPase Der [Deltaproteobacteria bacterium]